MSNKFWAADGDLNRQAAFAIGPPGNAAGAGDEAGAARELGDIAGFGGRVIPEPRILPPGQKVGNSTYAGFRPQVPDAGELGRDGECYDDPTGDDDLSRFGNFMVDNINNVC